MEKFKSFITEAKEEPYKLVILSHDDPLDPNETGPLIRNLAKELGIEVYLAEFMGCYLEDDKNNNKLLYTYPVDKDGKAQLPTMKKDSEYSKPIVMNPKNTLVMVRGLNAKDGCASWWIMARTFEYSGFKLINSVKCNEVCNNKWYNQMMFQRHYINTPETYLIRHSEGAAIAAEKLNNKYPMILKTSIGSQGVGVMWIESEKALYGIVQLLYREDPYIDIILQEYIKTSYDVRVIVASGVIMGAMKRPIIEGDFRSNVSQGSEPEMFELTELERKESLRAVESVDGDIVGVDFIPAKDREKDSPYFIEVNSTPGLTGIEAAINKSKTSDNVSLKNKGKSITKDILNNMKTILSKYSLDKSTET
jgi:RimK family alpha-L-glutamate ligase